MDGQDLDGWDYTDASCARVELFGSYCDDLRAGTARLCITFLSGLG